MFGLSQGPAVNRHEVTKGLFFSTIDHRFAPVADVMTVWAERDHPLEGLSVRRIVIIPGFVCLDRPLGGHGRRRRGNAFQPAHTLVAVADPLFQ